MYVWEIKFTNGKLVKIEGSSFMHALFIADIPPFVAAEVISIIRTDCVINNSIH